MQPYGENPQIDTARRVKEGITQLAESQPNGKFGSIVIHVLIEVRHSKKTGIPGVEDTDETTSGAVFWIDFTAISITTPIALRAHPKIVERREYHTSSSAILSP